MTERSSDRIQWRIIFVKWLWFSHSSRKICSTKVIPSFTGCTYPKISVLSLISFSPNFKFFRLPFWRTLSLVAIWNPSWSAVSRSTGKCSCRYVPLQFSLQNIILDPKLPWFARQNAISGPCEENFLQWLPQTSLLRLYQMSWLFPVSLISQHHFPFSANTLVSFIQVIPSLHFFFLSTNNLAELFSSLGCWRRNRLFKTF